jgi:hypothetical protein
MALKPCFALTGLAILFAGMSWAAPRPLQESPVSRIFAANAGDETIEIQVEKSRDGSSRMESLRLAPGEIAEVRRSSAEEVRIPDQRDLLIVTASAGFEPSAIRFGRPELTERAAVEDGDEVRIPFRQKAAGPRLNRGETAASQILWTGAGAMSLGLKLHGNAAAEVRALRTDGSVLGWVAFGASRDLEVTVDLSGFPQMKSHGGVVRQEVIVRRGQISTAKAGNPGVGGGLQRIAEAVTVGTGVFSQHVNWTMVGSNSLYYTVSNGPASTCGELNTYRNNSWLFGPGWLCTDAAGYKQQGPWTSAPSNQTDDPSFIRWPNGSTTTMDWHIWDTNCPSLQITSTPPVSWYGPATDSPFGACFDNRAYPSTSSYFQDLTTGLHYVSSTGAYSSPSRWYYPGEFLLQYSNSTSCGATWSYSSSWRPPVGAHVPGHTYKWNVCVSDGSACNACKDYIFTY